MTAVCTEWARRHSSVRLAAPDRPRPVFTAARARGEAPTAASGPWEALTDAWLQALSWPTTAA